MATFGCHSCKVDLSKYTSYEDSPCATCKLTIEHTNTKRAALFDSSIDLDEDETLAKYDIPIDEMQEGVDRITYAEKQIHKQLFGMDSLRRAVENQVFITVSGLILKLVKLSKHNPVMFEVVIKKMQFPFLSYSEIGDSMSPPCSKQNVLYHLKHAIKLFPDLESALLTDTRFTSGKYALKTVAEANENKKRVIRLQELVYGKDYKEKQHTMQEIRKIIDADAKLSEEVLNFNPYIEDEKDVI